MAYFEHVGAERGKESRHRCKKGVAPLDFPHKLSISRQQPPHSGPRKGPRVRLPVPFGIEEDF